MARKRFSPEQIITMLREAEVLLLCDKWEMDGMINRKWTEKSSKIPMKIAGQGPVGYHPTGRRHAPNEPN
jgi:hypothetical protein